MPYVCKRGRIYRAIASENEIPYLSLKELTSFVEENEYRGFVSLPKGPYDTDLATHVSRSLEFIQKYGDLGRIRNIIIGDNELSVRIPFIGTWIQKRQRNTILKVVKDPDAFLESEAERKMLKDLPEDMASLRKMIEGISSSL